MIRSCFRACVLSFLLGPVLAAPPPVPDTPAKKVLSAWIDALNSGDNARIESFLATYPSKWPLDEMVRWSQETGGYDLLEVQANEPTNVFFRVKQRLKGVEEFGRMEVSATEPRKLSALDVRRIPPGAKVEAVAFATGAPPKVITQVASLLEKVHVDPKMGKALAADVRKRAAHGDYRSLKYGEEIAKALTDNLRELGHDKHLEVRFSYFVQPEGPPPRNAAADARLRASNCGFEKVEHLRPNIGYLKFNFFGDPDVCAPTASAAMNFVADSDTLIIDLRDNNGGFGGMGTLLLSYLFAERTYLGANFRRADNVTMENWTLPYVPGRKFVDKPVFVLMSARTFSAGEGLAYLLQDLKRATLIGETTVGGSGTIEFKPVDEHFTLVLPTGSVIGPVSKSSWAGSGVVPDVAVSAADAFDEALRRARAEK